MNKGWKKLLALALVSVCSSMSVPQQLFAAAGEAYTEELSYRAAKKKLAAPEGMKVSEIGYDHVVLTWDSVEGAAGYQVEYSTDSANYTAAGTTDAGTLSFRCENLLTDVSYQLRVCALNGKGAAQNYSEPVDATPYLKRTKIVTAEPVNLHSIDLEWRAVEGAEVYYLYRKTDAAGSYKLHARVKDVSYEDTELTLGGTYWYKVRAVRRINGKNAKAKLSAACEVTLSAPAVVLERCEAQDYRSAALAWTQVEDADGYYIYRSVKKNGSYRKIKTVTGSSITAYTDRGIVPGKTFYYKVAAYYLQEDGSKLLSDLSEEKKVKTTMEAPNMTSAKQTNNPCLGLAWEKSEHAAGYRIYRSTSSDKGFKKLVDLDGGSTVGYEDRAVSPGVTYYYRIKAIYTHKSYKGLSQPSEIQAGTVAPSAPIGLTIKQGGTDVLIVSWQASQGAKSYNVYRSQSADLNKFTCIASGISDTTYADIGLKTGKTYYYRISAVGETAEGTQCRAVSYEVGGVAMNTRTLKLCVGVTKPLKAAAYREGEMIWTSSDSKVATVDAEGNVTGVGIGTAIVKATVAGKSASATVSVTPGTKNGIDVSVWQKDVDWCRVKASGVDFAFLRISNHLLQDYTFETKYANAAAVGIPMGVYCYSRAANAKEAVEEAQHVLTILDNRKLDYPIAMDLEDDVQKKLSKTELESMILSFKKVVEDAGYQFVLYSYVTFLNAYVDTTRLDGIDLWIARYRNLNQGTGYTGTGRVRFWQYNSGQYSGSDYHVDGITDEIGNLANVDVNLEY